jgi:GNAT superfamily N-acetyltransferase
VQPARLATQADGHLLRRFTCARTDDDFALEVQAWIRLRALHWLRSPDDPQLVLLEDDDGTLAGVIAHECLDRERPTAGRFIPVVGIAVDYHGQELGGALLGGVRDRAAELCPGGVLVWNVNPRNHDSLRMCEKLGFTDYIVLPEAKNMLRFEIGLP